MPSTRSVKRKEPEDSTEEPLATGTPSVSKVLFAYKLKASYDLRSDKE
jgi:hypothetical protein